MIGIAPASTVAEKPASTRAYEKSGCTVTPCSASLEMSRRCAASTDFVQPRSRPVPTIPPASSTRSPDEAAPAGGAGRRLEGLSLPLAAGREEHRRGRDRDERQDQRVTRLSARRTHQGQDNRGTGRARGSAPPTRSWPRCQS